MDKKLVLVLGILLAPVSVALAAPPASLPPMSMMLSSQNVTVVNLTPVDVAIYGFGLDHVTLMYGDRCYMFRGAPFAAVGVDGKRVLVRSRVEGPHQLYDEGRPVCAGDVLFWIDYQEYLRSAEVYRDDLRAQLRKQTTEERDKRIIRRLLDGQYIRK